MKISGFLGKPSNITYAYKKNQYLFVNSRFVKSKLINDAIYEGFGTNLMTGRHPFFVVFVDIDPEFALAGYFVWCWQSHCCKTLGKMGA